MNQGKALTVVRQGLLFAFDPDFPELFKEPCMKAGEKWNQALGKAVIQFTPEAAAYSKAYDGHNVISYGKNTAPSEEGHAAATHIVYSEDKIFEADIDFDLQHFAFTASDEPGKADAESVCLHEMGHALGLGHSENNESVMYPVLTIGTHKRTLSAEDVSNITGKGRS